MNPDRMQKIERLYEEVLEHEPSQRKSFLEQKCAGDESLREAVTLLLEQQAEVEGFLKAPAMDVAARALAQDQSHDPQPDLVGRSLLHYRVKEKIGQGGMGEVYRAHDSHLKRDVAIKVLPDIFSGDPERLARFDREARLLASLNHPNIAAIHGLEEFSGKHFLILELVEGETLAQRIAKGPLPIDEALDVCRQIAEGLEAAHEKGIIHRDLKPANVKITPEGKVKVLDFGLAKAFQGETATADRKPFPDAHGSDDASRRDPGHGGLHESRAGQRQGSGQAGRHLGLRLHPVRMPDGQGRRLRARRLRRRWRRSLKGRPDWNLLPSRHTWRAIGSCCIAACRKNPRERLHDIGDARIEIGEAAARDAVPVAAVSSPRRFSPRGWLSVQSSCSSQAS